MGTRYQGGTDQMKKNMRKKMTIQEGYMPFMEYRTYYRIVGEQKDARKAPLLCLHGGPGSTHNYMEILDRIADTGRQVISYDQIGCGESFAEGRGDLWKAQTWINELKQIRNYLHLDKVHILGQSWGGMLAIQYMIAEKPCGVQSLILSSTLSSSALWSHEQHRRIHFLTQQDQEAIARAEESGDYTAEDYLTANEHFMERYCAGEADAQTPECLTRPKKIGAESYLYAWGPNEYTPSGSLKDYDYTDRLGEISVPALIVSGTNDLCSPLVAKTMYDRIPDAVWELFEGARHMCFAEQNDKYCEMLQKWLMEKER